MQAANPAIGETFNSAPVAWQGKVFIGIAASDSGIAGRLMAFDADTGNQLWHFNTTLDSPSGGGLWTTYSLDPLTGEVFAPVGRAVTDPAADADIIDLQLHEIAAPEFAVDREVEQGEVAGSALHLEPDPDRPHVLRLQRALLPDEAPFVPGIATRYRR